MKPECELDESWCQEELPTALNRVVSLLHAHTIPSRSSKGEPGMVNMVHPADTVPTMDWLVVRVCIIFCKQKFTFSFLIGSLFIDMKNIKGFFSAGSRSDVATIVKCRN